jgi:hypothetical protein
MIPTHREGLALSRRNIKFNLPNGPLCLELALEHRSQRNVENLTDLEHASRAYAVCSLFVLLNSLKRETQIPTKVGLAHVLCVAAFAHSGADIDLDDASGTSATVIFALLSSCRHQSLTT